MITGENKLFYIQIIWVGEIGGEQYRFLLFSQEVDWKRRTKEQVYVYNWQVAFLDRWGAEGLSWIQGPQRGNEIILILGMGDLTIECPKKREKESDTNPRRGERKQQGPGEILYWSGKTPSQFIKNARFVVKWGRNNQCFVYLIPVRRYV